MITILKNDTKYYDRASLYVIYGMEGNGESFKARDEKILKL